jgi:PPE-repeat protein
VAYAVGGFDPGEGFTPTVGGTTGAKAPSVGIPAAAAAVSARDKRRARRRGRATVPERQYGDEFMDLDSDDGPGSESVNDPLVPASTRGAGPMGFGGITARDNADATGLITLPADAFGGAPTSPMLPSTWDSEGREE